MSTAKVMAQIAAERQRQDVKWGEQNHPDGTGLKYDVLMADVAKRACQANGPDEDNWRDVLAEEVYEAFAETDPAKLRAELIQVAAVAAAWVEAIDRRGGAS